MQTMRLTILGLALTLTGCAHDPNVRDIGTATGAVIGGLVGNTLTGGTGGTLIGAGAGALLGSHVAKDYGHR